MGHRYVRTIVSLGAAENAEAPKYVFTIVTKADVGIAFGVNCSEFYHVENCLDVYRLEVIADVSELDE